MLLLLAFLSFSTVTLPHNPTALSSTVDTSSIRGTHNEALDDDIALSRAFLAAYRLCKLTQLTGPQQRRLGLAIRSSAAKIPSPPIGHQEIGRLASETPSRA